MTIEWSGKTWNVGTSGGCSANIVNGDLVLTAVGYASAPPDRVRAEVISVGVAEYHGLHYVRCTGQPEANYMHAPLWLARTADPFTADGEMDIEHYELGGSDNYRYAIWERGSSPPAREETHDFENLHRGDYTTNVMDWHAASPYPHIEFLTYYDDSGWNLEESWHYTGPGVARDNDNVHVWLSIYAYPGSTGTDTLTFTECGFQPHYPLGIDIQQWYSGGTVKAAVMHSGAYYAACDRALKEAIENLGNEEALNAILALRAIEFKWKDGKRSAGFTAQEVAQVIPAAAHEIEGLWGINPDLLIPYIVGAIKQLGMQMEKKNGS